MFRWRGASGGRFWGIFIPSLSLFWTGCGVLIDEENFWSLRILDGTRTSVD